MYMNAFIYCFYDILGAIIIRLVSNDFEADVLHGEDSLLQKTETDFHGMEFEKQFACVYKVRIISAWMCFLFIS